MKSNKVLVTGSSGFIGSHVADVLTKNNMDVHLFDYEPSSYKTDEQKEFVGNILDPKDIDKAMNNCDYVYHFAAQADIGLSSKNPLKTITSNIIGTQNMLDLAVKHKVKRFFLQAQFMFIVI